MRIGCGCVNLGSASSGASWSDHVALVRAALDSGVTLLDTSNAYNSGISERVIGTAVKGRRDDVTIATKFGYVFRPRSRVEQQLRKTILRLRPASTSSSPVNDSPGGSSSTYDSQDFSPSSIRPALEASLRRLRTDYVDVYQFHGPSTLLDDALAELVTLQEQGLIRQVGVGAETMRSAAEWAAVAGVDVIQLPFGVLDPETISVLRPTDTIIAPERPSFWVRGVLGGGVLAAAMRDAGRVDHDKHQLVADLAAIADDADMKLDELAIRWIRSHDEVDSMLVGISSAKHLQRNVYLAGLAPLPEDVVRAVASAQQEYQLGDSGSPSAGAS